MSNVGNLTLTSSNAAQFRASGEAQHLKHWLREVRRDMTGEACRQVVSHACSLIDLFGEETPDLTAGPPARIRARLEAVNLPRHSPGTYRYRFLLRAAMAIYAATYDLDTPATRELMDQRRRHRRPVPRPRLEERAAAPCGDLLEATQANAIKRVSAACDTEQVPVDPATLPAAVRPIVEAVNHSVTAQLALDDTIDVAGVTRAVMRRLSPAARVRLAAELPEAAKLPATINTASAAPSLAQLAEEAVVTAIAERYADLRPQ